MLKLYKHKNLQSNFIQSGRCSKNTSCGVPYLLFQADGQQPYACKQFSVSRSQLPEAARKQIDKRLQEAAAGTLKSSMKIGDSIEAGEIGGTKLYAKLVSASTNSIGNHSSIADSSADSVTALSSSANTTSSHTFVFQYKNWLGKTKNAFKVALKCSWYKNESNSAIKNLTGTYTVLDNSFSCDWDKSSGSYLTDTYAALYMYAYHEWRVDLVHF